MYRQERHKKERPVWMPGNYQVSLGIPSCLMGTATLVLPRSRGSAGISKLGIHTLAPTSSCRETLQVPTPV